MTELDEFVRANNRAFPIRYRPAANAHEILRHSQLPYLPIVGMSVPFAAMFAEAKKLEAVAVSHRAYGEQHRGWKSLVLHGISSVHTQGAEHYALDPEERGIYRWTDIAKLCPETATFLQRQLHYEYYHRVRFMYLEPGGYIAPHTDTDAYYLGAINIALNHPQGCHFYMEGVGEVPFFPGAINKLALVNRHAVVNHSNETRIHMIVHGSPDGDHWWELYERSYRSLLNGQSAVRFLEF